MTWPVCQTILDGALFLWKGLKADLASAGVPADKVAAIDGFLAAYGMDITQQKARDGETDANKITSAIPDVFDYFTYPAPTDTLRLDGTFRQLQIDAEYSDWANSQKDIDDTKVVWARLKPLVAVQAPTRPGVAGSATVVADVDNTLQTSVTVLAAQDAAMLQAAAQNGLDQTDTCEQVFK